MKRQPRTRYMQVIAAFTASLSCTSVVAHISWASPALPILQSSNSPFGFAVSDEVGSWMVSILYLAVPPGAFLGGYVAERFGRKISMLIGGVMSLVPWFIMMIFKYVVALYVAKTIAGLGLGIISTVAYIYIGEIADDDIRGMLGMCSYLLNPIGTLVILSAGPYMSYDGLSMLCCSIPILFLVSFIWMPETPHFFLKRGNVDEAKKSVIRLTGSDGDEDIINERIRKLQKLINYDKAKKKVSLREFFRYWKYLKPFFLMTGIQIISLLSGTLAIEAYMQTIIAASKSSLSPELSSIIFGIVRIPSALVALVLCDRIGRRPLFAISGLGCSIALLGEGVYFYLQDHHEDLVENISWLPTTGLSIYKFMNPIGISSIPAILISEIFPIEIKEISSSLLQLFVGLASFTATKIFAPVSNVLGIYAMFWIFSAISFSGGVYIYLLVPETKGKCFADIQKEIYGKEYIPLEDDPRRKT